MLYGMTVTEWFLDPSLGPIIAPLLIAAFGAAMVLLIAGARARYAWRTAGATVIVLDRRVLPAAAASCRSSACGA